MSRCVVVGAGITGLTAAYAWHREHPGDEVVVLEAGDRVGGKLGRVQLSGTWYDTGAEAVLARVPHAVDLMAELGLTQLAPRTTSASVVLPSGRHPLPAGTLLGVPTSADGLDGLLSPDGVERVRAEASLPPLRFTTDRTVGDLLRERLGDEVVDRLVEPLLGGVYAGQADRLSVTATMPALAAQLPHHGTVLAAAAAARDAGARSREAAAGTPDGPVFVTLPGGVGSLPDTLAAALPPGSVRLRTPAHTLSRTAGGLELTVGAGHEPLTADAVVLTAPAGKAARLLAEVAPGAVEPLQGIPYASMAVVAMAFRGQPLAPGSGLLVPPVTGRLVKGVTISSQKWPHLDGDGLLRVRSSVGRYLEEDQLQRPDDELVAAVVADVVDLLALTDPEPVETRLVRWGGGLPQYLVGHVERVAAVRAAVAEVPGLVVAGAAYDGVGVPACIASARRAVATLT
ncbi:oxygen-dependent protoporphyrinogen oxidase [Klenkia marina]|uniref:Coproporphyrinogen III oxidase n=1 Tax=Klenkia marina TaxID=1960309 RepID=A0A1G4YUK4_9ACTN|nr:protoporphyrinogen oxidase [Klenkia marina]SCX57139.1 oxygen-dependent protoporphyrinogen oxidase [Klenkia marina]